MICISPISLPISGNSGLVQKGSGENLSFFKSKHAQTNDKARAWVPCGKCGACRQNRRADWTFRLKIEQAHAISSFFIGLSYSEENVRWADNIQTLHKPDLQNFIKSIRKENSKYSDIQIRYYAIGEYGTQTQRPHYHILLFNADPRTIDKLLKIWKFGIIDLGTVEDASIHYCTKYHVNYDKHESLKINRNPEFAIMSLKPAIGSQYLNNNTTLHKQNQLFTVRNNGFKQRLPRYYKDKIFNPIEKMIYAIKSIKTSRNRRLLEIARLRRLKIADPDKYISDQEIRLSLEVKMKINEKSKNKI